MLMLDDGQEVVPELVDEYGLTFPVLNDADYAASIAVGNTAVEAPYHILVGRDMTVLQIAGSEPTETALANALAAEWPDVDRPVQPSPEDLLADDAAPPTGNPFSAESVVTWDSGAACSVGAAGDRGRAATAVLLTLIPVLALRRRR